MELRGTTHSSKIFLLRERRRKNCHSKYNTIRVFTFPKGKLCPQILRKKTVWEIYLLINAISQMMGDVTILMKSSILR
jgi:hypothetical protein